MTRVIVVDDHALVREGLRTLLQLAGIDVVAEGADGEEAIEAIVRHRADAVLLDLRMPHRDGIWVLEQLRERGEEIPVLVLTTFDDDELVLGALRAGARGYLLKDVTLDRLARAVRTLADGGTLISPSLTDRLLRVVRATEPTADVPATTVQPLTERELDVLRLIAEGYSNREIAGLLHLAEGTVKNHSSTILQKTGARDRTQAVLRALRDGALE
ncbi:response regulator [Brachybacterium sacelli]|uniref:DNA-binding NarL/FixJ family response regulator n=1 Tax=Brachybacterium sacelli TaxID=173364 RepID=A0ABS4X0S9_9MICO|nr:response regulator transcription factor [Brachybacterium sacelli]MBP2382060.1 DNA-binding NarL/FixJ family response regulator [Brachybacterium sacelli]